MHTLTELVARGPIAPATLGRILDGVFAAIDAAGGGDRALVPDRVIVHDDMRVDLAPPPRKPKLSSRTGQPELAAFDATLASFCYMAPEQVRGAATVDERADIYAIGAMAFRALTGRQPFEGQNALTLIALKLDRPPPALGDRFSPMLQSFVRIAMATNADDRYRRLGVARAALRDAF